MADENTAGAAPKAARTIRKKTAQKPATAKNPAAKKPAAKSKPAALPGPTNWSAVKRRYQNNRKMTAENIAGHYKIDLKRLREIARERGWRRPGSQRPRRKAATTMPERVLDIADGQLTQLELLMEEDQMPDAPEVARRLRDINQVVRNNPKQGPTDGAPERAAGAPSKAGDTDAERWRLELVERIKKLKRKLEAQ